MQLLPPAVVNRLDALVHSLRAQGLLARRKDVVGLLVLYRVPRGAAGLGRIIETYLSGFAAVRRGRAGMVSLTLTLPSPVSLRIDLVVDSVRQLGLTVYRQDLVGALVMKRAPRSPAALAALMRRYGKAHARDAAVIGRPQHLVLSRQTPDPGRRRLP